MIPTISMPARCPFCEQAFELELSEIYPEDRSFQLLTCCEALYEEALAALSPGRGDPAYARALLETLGWSTVAGRPPRSLYTTDWGHLEVDQGLELIDIKWKPVKAFIAQHHEHNRPPVGWKFGFGVRNWNDLVGVCVCGRPTAPGFEQPGILEITRVCTNRLLPPPLTRHACSMLYGASARRGRREGYERVITYTRWWESGVSLKAAGFRKVALTQGGSWNRRRRPRRPSTDTEPKARWERTFPENRGRRLKEPSLQGELFPDPAVRALRRRP